MPARRLAILKTYFGFAPKTGPKIMRIDLNFIDAVAGSDGLFAIEFDASADQNSNVFATPQAIYLDNRTNAFPVTITPAGADMGVSIPSNSQGMLPFATSGKLRFSAKCGSQNVQLYGWLFNTPQPYYVATIV